MKTRHWKKKLILRLIFLTAISFLFSCGYNPKRLTPSFPDTDRMTFREYHVIETKPKIRFEYTSEYPLTAYPKSKGGLLCLPIDQALEIKRKWENRLIKSDDRTIEIKNNLINTQRYENLTKAEKIQLEKEILTVEVGEIEE